jgi:hypothetical protein
VAIGGPDGRTALVADGGDGTVTVVHLSSMRADAPMPAGPEPIAVALGRDATRGVVVDFEDGGVRSFDVTTRSLGAPVAVGPGPTGVVVSTRSRPGSSTASMWVAVGSSVVGIDPASSSVSVTIPVHHVAEAVALDHRGDIAYVAGLDGTVTPVHLSSGTSGRAVSVGGRPSAIVVPAPRR